MSHPPLSLVAVLAGLLALLTTARVTFAVPPRIEAAFELPQVTGNPFDFTQNDARVTLAGPDGREIALPAFFDGGQTWRVRHTPAAPGRYAVRAVTLNGQDAQPRNLQPQAFDVTEPSGPGFVRLSSGDPMRFAFDDGSPYYPVGYNLGWRGSNMPPLAESLAKMGQAGVNWTRIWSNHWDGKNLEWVNGGPSPEIGTYNLDAARLWDETIAATESNGVYFQLVLQHHGQYSSRVNPNWNDNPFNRANGGFLDEPERFFTDPRAIELTKCKYRYVIARWGYSPAIMAWELFNEVEYTDGFEKDPAAVAAWHGEMARFLREHDPYKHLVTTSSRVTEPALWSDMDYYQAHTYPPDVVTAVAALDERRLDRAYFYGEIGSSAASWREERGQTLHRALWSSLMSTAAGAAQYWYWDNVEPNNLFHHYTAAQRFIRASGLLAQTQMRPLHLTAETADRGPLRFGPGLGWAKSDATEFTVQPSGFVTGLGGMSSFLQGDNHRDMFPAATFHVDFPENGAFVVRLSEAAQEGSRLEITVDGRHVASLDVAPAPQPRESQERRNTHLDLALEAPIPAGKHSVTLTNTGKDWLQLREIVLTPYSSQLAVVAKGNAELIVLWVHRRDESDTTPITGTLTIPNLREGPCRVTWWDTERGEAIREDSATTQAGSLTLQTPPITTDLAAWVRRGE